LDIHEQLIYCFIFLFSRLFLGAVNTFEYTNWSACSIPCGATGTQTRTRTCKSSITGGTVSASLCTGALPTTQTCNMGTW
jgi:hypothetical protein